jgi:hypothetical protein
MGLIDKLDWEILNATADDCENLEQIYRQICFEIAETSDGKTCVPEYRPITGAPLLSELGNHIRTLVEKGWLTVVRDEEGLPLNDLKDLSYVWRAWFDMTPDGRKAWESAECLTGHG